MSAYASINKIIGTTINIYPIRSMTNNPHLRVHPDRKTNKPKVNWKNWTHRKGKQHLEPETSTEGCKDTDGLYLLWAGQNRVRLLLMWWGIPTTIKQRF